MALNFTTPNTFSPNTVIASAAVNSNFSTIANVFTGLEAETSTLAKLKVDIDPTTALEVATKQYVDHYSTLRRPVLQWVSITTVTAETGNQGTSGSATILFPDGTVRSDSTASHIVFDITRNAALTVTAQSGLRTTLSEATNTWYAIYAVKSQVNSTDFVLVGDTLLPLQANYATLNSNFGTSSWVYLGCIRNGDNSGQTGDILKFIQGGHMTFFRTATTGTFNGSGLRLATTGGAASVTWSYAAGTGTTSVPNNFIGALFMGTGLVDGAARDIQLDNGAVTIFRLNLPASKNFSMSAWADITGGTDISATGANMGMDVFLNGFVDVALGVGANPIL